MPPSSWPWAPPTAASAARTRFWKWALPWRSWSICASVAESAGTSAAIEERYRKLGSIRIATKYPSITRAHFARTGTQVEIVYLHGNIELAPITGMAERIVDITATGTTLRENNLEIVEEVLASTARFFANGCALRTDERIVALARVLAENAPKHTYAPIAGASNPVQPTLS